MRYAAEFEYLEAAHYWRYEWERYDALDGDSQALIIAHWRTKQRMLAVEAEQERLRRNQENHGTSRSRTHSRRRR